MSSSVFKLFTSLVPPPVFSFCLQIMPPKRTKSSVATPAKKHTRRVKSSQDSAVVVEQPQPQQLSAEVLPQALLEQIIHKVSDEVTRRLSSTSEKRSANASQILDRGSDLLGGVGAGAEQVSEVSVLGIPADSPGESMIEGAVSQFQDRLSGELPTVSPTLPNTLFISPSLPIDARVSAKLRAKILKNEFIDFGALATNPVLESKFQVVLQSEGGTQPPSLALEPVTKTKKLLTIASWTSSFMIFVGVYTSQFPSEAPALMKYGEIVQDLASRGHDWHYYDENFRYLRQNQPSAFPWGVIHWELWMRSQQSLNKKQSLPGNSFRSRPSETSNVPTGYCFKFHKGGHCAGCSFKHSCPKCDGAHRMSICTFRPHSKQLPRTTSNAKSSGAKSSPPNANKVQ